MIPGVFFGDTFSEPRCWRGRTNDEGSVMSVDVKRLYEDYGPMVLRRCRRLLGSEEDAVEAMQEVFVRVLERADRLDERAPSSLLYTMATNHCLNRIRSSSRRPEVLDSELIGQIAALGDQEERMFTRLTLGALMGKERASTRTMAALYWVDGMTYEEVAAEVGMSVSGVRKRLRGLRVTAAKAREVAS